jgi:CheY-like chemotaxis protein
MRTLLEDGIDKAARGLTTLDEVLRVVSRGNVSDRTADTPSEGSMGPTAVPAEPASPLTGRVLVVEDSQTIGSVVKYFLELEGLQVTVVENGLLGLEMALQDCPDLIVSDINMPGMSGLAMVKALRLDPRTSRVRIMMLTSESSAENEADGFAAGADDYILKPVDPKRLAARVKAMLARSRPTAA